MTSLRPPIQFHTINRKIEIPHVVFHALGFSAQRFHPTVCSEPEKIIFSAHVISRVCSRQDPHWLDIDLRNHLSHQARLGFREGRIDVRRPAIAM